MLLSYVTKQHKWHTDYFLCQCLFNKQQNVYFTRTKGFILKNPRIRMNGLGFFWKVCLQSFTPVRRCGMLPFSLTRGQSLLCLYSEIGPGTLSKWVGLKQLVCHSNLSTAAVLWIWLHLAKKSPRVAWQPAIASVSVALHGCQILSERSFILQTQWEKNTQVSAREAVLKLYIHSG